MSVSQSPVDGHRHGGTPESRIPRPSSLVSPMTSPVPLRRAGSLRLRGEKGVPSAFFTSPSLTSPRQKHFPTINESSVGTSPRHHGSLQSLTPKRPTPGPADDDDNDSLRSFGSTQSACDHAHFARNGTTFSGRRMKYIVHCSPQHETEEYLTPTQRAARRERRLKALLAQSKRDLEAKDECIFRLTKEVVELRLLRGDGTTLVTGDSDAEAGGDSTDAGRRQPAVIQWTKTNGLQSPVGDSGIQVCASSGDAEGLRSGLGTPVSLSDSGHFDDILIAGVAATNHSSPGSVSGLEERRALLEHLERRLEEQARRHAERAQEDRRSLVDLYERKMEDMALRHVAQTQEERRELESAYEKRLIEAARALAQEKERAESALRERDALRSSLTLSPTTLEELPAGLEKRLADALQRLQVTQGKTGVETDVRKWTASDFKRVEDAIADLEARLSEERKAREEALKEAEELRKKMGDLDGRLCAEIKMREDAATEAEELREKVRDLEGRLCGEMRMREDAVAEAEMLREADLLNSVRLSDLETRLGEELRIRERNDGEVEGLRERLRLSDARLADVEGRLNEELAAREEAVRNCEKLSDALSLEEARAADLEKKLSDEAVKKEFFEMQMLQIKALEVKLAEERNKVEELNAAGDLYSQIEKLEKLLSEKSLRASNLEKELREERLVRIELERTVDEERFLRSTIEETLSRELSTRTILEEKQEEREKLNESIVSKEFLIADLESKLTEERKCRQEKTMELEKLTAEAKRARDEAFEKIEELSKTVLLRSSQLADTEKSLAEERSKAEEKEKEAEESEEARQLLSAQIEELERKLSEERSSVEKKQEEVESLMKLITTEFQPTIRSLTETVAVQQQCLKELEEVKSQYLYIEARLAEGETRLTEGHASLAQTALLNDNIQNTLSEGLREVMERSSDMEAERDAALARVEELTKMMAEQEERHKEINLEMYRKGQEAAKFERRDEVLLQAQAAPQAIAVPELLAQLESTEKELDKLKDSESEKEPLLSSEEAVALFLAASFKAMYRRLLDSQAGPSNPETTLMFLKSAFYYFLTDEANSQGHLNAIQSILGFSEAERQSVESHTYFRR